MIFIDKKCRKLIVLLFYLYINISSLCSEVYESLSQDYSFQALDIWSKIVCINLEHKCKHLNSKYISNKENTFTVSVDITAGKRVEGIHYEKCTAVSDISIKKCTVTADNIDLQ